MAEDEEREEQEPQVVVTDRRRFKRGEGQGEAAPSGDETAPTSEASAPSPAQEASQPGAAASETAPEPEVTLPTVPEIVRVFILELSQHAWIHMGLVANPVTHLVAKDLSQARLAIDCMAALLEQLQAQLDSAEKRELQTLLSNLRINFVQRSQS